MKKLLLSMRLTNNSTYDEQRNAIALDYITFFEKLGYLVILIPNNTKFIQNYFNDTIDAVVFSGGDTIFENDSRSQTESQLFEIASHKQIPIIGICRGFQFLAHSFGLKVEKVKYHVNTNHKIISPIPFLNNQVVNSYHNYGVQTSNLPNDIKILASSQNILEAFIVKNLQILGIQWHPERQQKEFDFLLFQKFLEGLL